MNMEPHLATVSCLVAVSVMLPSYFTCISPAKPAEGKAVEDAFEKNDSERACGVGGFLQQRSIGLM